MDRWMDGWMDYGIWITRLDGGDRKSNRTELKSNEGGDRIAQG
jgi:hypothetical protein